MPLFLTIVRKMWENYISLKESITDIYVRSVCMYVYIQERGTNASVKFSFTQNASHFEP